MLDPVQFSNERWISRIKVCWEDWKWLFCSHFQLSQVSIATRVKSSPSHAPSSGQITQPFCAPVYSSVNRDNNCTFFIGMLGLYELIVIKCLEQWCHIVSAIYV